MHEVRAQADDDGLPRRRSWRRSSARLTELGYLDDEAFARAWVESRDRARPRGEHALRRELQLKGVDRALVDEVLRPSAVDDGGARSPREPGDGEEPHGPDEAAAERLLRKKLPAILREPDPRRRRQRAYALLARSGFSPDVCSLGRAAGPRRSGEVAGRRRDPDLVARTCRARVASPPRRRCPATRSRETDTGTATCQPVPAPVVGYAVNRTRTRGRAPGEPRHRWGAGGARAEARPIPEPKRMPVVRSPSPNLVSTPGAFIPPGGRN